MHDFLDRATKKRWVLIAVLMITYSMQSLTITASKQQSGGGFAYDATAAVLLAEALKLVFALAMLPSPSRRALDPRGSLPYVVPAILYMVQNRLVFEALRYLSPPEYQLLNNLKLLTTSIVYRVVMRRQLRVLQWMALLLLAVGMSLASQPPTNSASTDKPETASSSLSMWTGIAIMTIMSWCSAFAGVANEWLIKKSANVLEANVWLYSYGVLACSAQLGSAGWVRLFRLEGFTAVTWFVVVCNTFLGQSVAFLLRYADSIVKLYAVSAAMGFTTLVSVLFFGFQVQFQMLAGYMTSMISVSLYYAPPELLNKTDIEVLTAVGCSTRAEHGKKVAH